MKEKLYLSFSGGKTSGYMTRRALTELQDLYEMIVLFANTGQENEETLQFVHDCDTHFGFNTVWLEAVIDPILGNGTKHKVVTFETANRDGSEFEEMVKKFGIPNKSYKHCTREMKLRPMESYTKLIGWADCMIAIGIRADETRRVSDAAVANRIIYPLIDWVPTDKQDVNDWWEDQDFNLNLPEHRGNCKWCWKKSDLKHYRLIRETPEIFDFPRRMEKLYPLNGRGEGGRVFFRHKRSTVDLFKIEAALREEAAGFLQGALNFDPDEDGGCSESCELYAME
jgi:predicted phosphoadenosine phosphosulfate sulfurtransferase